MNATRDRVSVNCEHDAAALAVAAALKLPPPQLLVVGDGDTDMAVARRAGVTEAEAERY